MQTASPHERLTDRPSPAEHDVHQHDLAHRHLDRPDPHRPDPDRRERLCLAEQAVPEDS